MLIPKEQPYLIGLNSYYLYFEKFIEHLQGEIGSGCLYCQSPDQEILVYFYESDIIRAVTQLNGEHAQVSHDLKSVVQALTKGNFLVTVYYLDSASIFYWAEMPAFQRKKTKINITDVTLPNLAARLLEKEFSGFIDIDIEDQNNNAMLFYHQGERRGGSYSWGKGGLSASDDDYNRLLLIMTGAKAATFDIGRFIDEAVEASFPGLDEGQYLSDLNTAIKEFLNIYIQVIRKKIKTDPIVLLKQEFLDTIDQNHILDPFKSFFELDNDGTIEFAPNVDRKEITAGIVDCTWQVIRDHNLKKKFRVAIDNWDYKTALEERGITVIQ